MSLKEESTVKTSMITTNSGVMFDLLLPDPDTILIEDIAHALSMCCRFSGHTDEFYSVAQHSVLGAWQCPEELQFQFLMHDAHEAYTTDIPRPFKWTFPAVGDMEKTVAKVVRQKFGLPEQLEPFIKEVDDRMLMTEKRDLLKNSGDWGYTPEPYSFNIRPWMPAEAKEIFLETFWDLVP